MHLEERHVSNLNKVIDAVAGIRGVVGVFLFGSFARGDYDAYSDYDLIVLFKDKASMWRDWDELFRVVGNLKMHLHVIPETFEELKTANPVFLEELFRYGKILFARLPLEVFVKPLKLESFCLIFYDMGGLSYKDKMRAVYFLYRKRGVGAVARVGGVKLSEGCLLVPSSASDFIIDRLAALGVGAKKLNVYISEEIVKSRLGQKQ